MMTEKILELLRSSGADAFELTEVEKNGWEFYLIKHKLDQNRARNVEHIRVKVYKKSEDGNLLGSASGEIAPTASEEEAKAMIDKLLSQAVLVKNPYYEIIPRYESTEEPADAADPAVISTDFLKALSSVSETEGEDINSAELFVDAVKVRFINSNGLDVTAVYPSSMAEVVMNARKDGHEIEMYRMYRSGTCDAENLKKEVEETLAIGRDRLLAVPTPALGKADVVFSTDAALEIYYYFTERMNTAYIYRHLSDWECGKEVLSDVQGDRVTVCAVKTLPNSSRNVPFDGEGAPVRDLTIVEDGVAKAYWGGRQYSWYLGITDSFSASNFVAEGGSHTAQELRSGNYLEIVEFSDFQVDAITGDIAGEIRLGYLHENGKTTVVTGGSVSGNMKELGRNMFMSKEQKQYDCFLIPAVTKLSGVSITGA